MWVIREVERGCCRTEPTRISTTSTCRAERRTRVSAPKDATPHGYRRRAIPHHRLHGQRPLVPPFRRQHFVTGIIDIEALRQFRVMNLNSNWMKDLRTEVFRRMYEAPIHPKNLWIEQDPLSHAEVDEVYRANIDRLVALGAYTRPATTFDGARYFPMDPDLSPAEAWKEARALWADDGRAEPMADRGYDVVIVGGGHNGLTCGCYLAKAGQRVLVLEARDVVGGGCATQRRSPHLVSATISTRTSTASFIWVLCIATSSSNVMARPTSGPRTSSPTSSRTAGPWCARAMSTARWSGLRDSPGATPTRFARSPTSTSTCCGTGSSRRCLRRPDHLPATSRRSRGRPMAWD